ncbi:MAG: PorV/PorQ family protein [Calditrichia bacterium]|nr:PorV/PorQ family protein [Calditrichia bacterium]MCK5455279.1 PorV/PorQ family protein [Calditrichia bacterium]
MRLHLSISMVIVFFFIGTLQSQSAGTTSFEFLKSQYSPRGAAMGGNLMAVSGDIQALLYNPATLASNTNRLWDINYIDHLIDFKAGQLSYAQPMKTIGNFYTTLFYFNYGEFNETDEFGDQTGRTFNAAEFALSAGMSNHLGEGFDYGLGIKYLYSSLESYNASAIALDAGLMYTVPLVEDLTLGLSLLNFGMTLDNYTSHQERLPLVLQFGFSKRLAHLPLLLTGSFQDMAVSGDKVTDYLKRFAIGGEFDISEIIKFRLGYQNQINQDVKPIGRTVLSGFSLGLGINWRQFRFGYSYSNFGDLGSQNRLGISGSF